MLVNPEQRTFLFYNKKIVNMCEQKIFQSAEQKTFETKHEKDIG